MVGILGSEEAFYYQYGTQFSASDACLVSRETLTRIHQNEILFTSREDVMSSLYSKFFFVNPEYDIENFKNKYYIISFLGVYKGLYARLRLIFGLYCCQ